MTRRLHSIPLAVAGLAVVLASCGGQPFPQSASTSTTVRPADSDPTATRDPHAWLLASVQRTSQLRSARLTMTMTISGLSAETVTASGAGLIDFVNHEASISMKGDADGEPISVDVRLVDGKLYTRSVGDWVSQPVNAVGADTPNPTNYLGYLQAVSSDVRADGHETIRGVDTIRYRANLDFDRALAHATTSAQRKIFAQALTLFGGVKAPMTAWVDGDGHVRKEQVSLDLGSAMSAAGVPVSGHPKIAVTLELYDFGVPVHVVVPVGAIDAAAAAQARAAQSDLRNALTAEKTVYVDSQSYSADPAMMKQIESALDWGGKLQVVVGDAAGVRNAVVCLSERSAAGPVFSLADVASGPNAGTYYGKSPCPRVVDDVSMSRLASSW